MDIKTFKKYCRNIHLGYWIAIIVFSLLALRSTFLYLRALYSGVPTGYFSYQNVQVQVQETTMDGKLNQYILIKGKNYWWNYCVFIVEFDIDMICNKKKGV